MGFNLSLILKTWKVRWKWEEPDNVVDKAEEVKNYKDLLDAQGNLNQKQEAASSLLIEEGEAL